MSSQDIKTLLGGLLFLLYIWFDSLRPSQHFLSQVFIGSTSTKQRTKYPAQGHNAVPLVRLKPATPRSQVKQSTTEPPRSPILLLTQINTDSGVGAII